MSYGTVMVETLGSVQFYDVDTDADDDDFCVYVVQDHEQAEHLMERLFDEKIVLWNEDEPEFLTRFTLVE